MEHIPSWETNSRSSSHEIIILLWEWKVHNAQNPAAVPYPEVDESGPHLQILFLRSTLILPYHLRLGLSTSLFRSGFPTEVLSVFFICPVRVTCFPPLILLI
jgi:hypothetical protein